jgi:hypothetical protein
MRTVTALERAYDEDLARRKAICKEAYDSDCEHNRWPLSKLGGEYLTMVRRQWELDFYRRQLREEAERRRQGPVTEEQREVGILELSADWEKYGFC